MRIIPFDYHAKSLFVRRSATILTIVGIGATVAVLAGVLALRQGFSQLFAVGGRPDVAVVLRPGAQAEGESFLTEEQVEILVKSRPEFALDETGRPLAGPESYLALRLRKSDGGETNVPLRGTTPATFAIRGDGFRILEGRRFEPGEDEVVVGRPLADRIRGARVGDVIPVNTTPFRVVGIFETDGPFSSEIWGDGARLAEALDRPGVWSRVIGVVRPDVDFGAFAAAMEKDRQVPALVKPENVYLAEQTTALSVVLLTLGEFLGFVMGLAAVFTGTNTMLAAISARTREIGILVSLGFRPRAIFAGFLLESLLLGALGGLAGCLIVLPLHGIRTGTTNFQTFTEVAFAFQVTPSVLLTAILFAAGLGVLGGAWPAWRAARLSATAALRRR